MSFGFTKKLQSRGHRVIYLGIPDFEGIVRSQGFEFISFLEEIFPLGTFRPQSPMEKPQKAGILKTLKAEQRRLKAYREYLFSEQVSDYLESLHPDLVIIDSYMAILALIAYRYHLPTILISVTLPQTRFSDYPPLTSDLPVPETAEERRHLDNVWRRLQRQNARGIKLARLFGLDYDMAHWIHEMAIKANFPLTELPQEYSFTPSVNLPELVLCPRDFDYKGPDRPDTYYIEPCILPEQSKESFPWEKLSPNKKLVFCSFGSQSNTIRGVYKIFRSIIKSFENHPDYQLVMSLGERISPLEFHTEAENVILVNWAPYADLLHRASVMINHAGLGTVKECIYYQTPMIGIPFQRDQPGNAGRVSYHNLGIILPKNLLSTANYLDLVIKIEANPLIRENIQRMSGKFHEIEESGIGIRTVEQFINNGYRYD